MHGVRNPWTEPPPRSSRMSTSPTVHHQVAFQVTEARRQCKSRMSPGCNSSAAANSMNRPHQRDAPELHYSKRQRHISSLPIQLLHLYYVPRSS